MLTHIRQTHWIPQEYMHHRYFSLQELITQVLYMSATKILKLHLKCIYVSSHVLQYEPYILS